MINFSKVSLFTESDVEQKVAYPILRQILGFEEHEIRTKDYLAPTDLDKGAGKKYGYFPDYVIYLGGLPVIVVEAKDPGISSSEGYREARLYANEVNKRFPEDINPVKYVIGINGKTIVYSNTDCESTEENKIEDFCNGSQLFQNFFSKLNRISILQWANEIRNKIEPRFFRKPLKMLGGPSKQSMKIPCNSFAEELAPILRRYFDPNSSAHEKEILEKGYCSSNEISQYNTTLEALLKDTIPSSFDIPPIETTPKKAENFDSAIKTAIGQKKEIPDPLILLLGGVGSGKTTFIERYFNFLISNGVKEKVQYVHVNFNNATESLDDVETWVCDEFLKSLEKTIGTNLLAFENLKEYFAEDLRKIAEPLKLLKETDTKEYANLISKKLLEWFEDKRKLCFSLINFLKTSKGITFVIAFDNIDRRDREQQLKVFQVVQWFRNKSKTFSILSFRDETYDLFRNEPPLDAFLKPFAFRITAPRFFTVVKKRLELAFNYLSLQASQTLTYTLPNGMNITYPNSKVGIYLLAIYKSIFNPSRKVSQMLEAVSGKNIRKALEIFTEILVSGHFNENLIFSVTEGETSTIPEWQIIRALMRTSYRYFSEEHGFLTNIFAIPNERSQANIFLISEILEYLADNRKRTYEGNIEGYVLTSEILDHMAFIGYLKEDTNWALLKLLGSGLIIADHQSTKNLKDSDYIKITASGYFHCKFFPCRNEYLHNVALDTYFGNEELAKEVANKDEDSFRHMNARIKALDSEIEEQSDFLKCSFPGFNEKARAHKLILERIKSALNFAMGAE